MSDSISRPGTSGTHATGGPGAFGVSASRIDFWLFVVMLVLALVGVGVSQAVDTGGRMYWLALVLIYAAINIVRSYQHTKGQGRDTWQLVRSHVLHWVGAMVAIDIVLWFESTGITDRGPASDYSLLLLALSCFLAGVHFDWRFMILGGILALIVVGLGVLDQLSLYLTLIPVVMIALWVVYKRTTRAAA